MAKQKKQEATSPKSILVPSLKTRILGLDLSLTGTGYCLFRGNMDALEMDLVDPGKLKDFNRLDSILNAVMSHLAVIAPGDALNSTLVVMEDFSFASKGSGLFQIAGLGYIIRYELWRQGIDFVLVPPTVLKKFVTGVGNADKSIMLKEIYKRWEADINDDNIGDAYGLMRIGRALLGLDTGLPAFQKEALKGIVEVDSGH